MQKALHSYKSKEYKALLQSVILKVEVRGVEPRSEKVNRQASTCLAAD